MNLGFELYFDKAKELPTYFPQKILNGLGHNGLIKFSEYAELMDILNGHHLPGYIDPTKHLPAGEKRTTIREDLRWHDKLSIHFLIYNRNPKRYQFAPVIPVKRVEPIEFLFNEVTYKRAIILGDKFIYHQTYDEIEHYDNRFTQLWQHEGFESEKAFWDWFKKPLKGVLIHWIY